MLITDHLSWEDETFEAYVEGMCRQIEAFPYQRVAFWAPSTPEVILTFFACWKIGKIACPLSPRLPSAQPALEELETELFTPSMPHLETPKPREWQLDQLATFLFTSGSMGRPKIACHSLGNLVMSARGSNKLIPLEPSDRWALTLPLNHVGGLGILMRSYLAKSSVLLSADWTTATHLSLVPTQLYRLMKNPAVLPHLKTILLGGAPLPDLETPWETPWHVLPSYGMTEMSSQIVTGHHVHPFAEIKIASDQEIWVKGAVLFQGYYEKEKGRVLPLQDGWFATKDLGCWKEGKFYILGRKDNLFISGGENIQPEEIEEVIRRVCGFQEAVVVPIADEEFGARPGVFLQDPLQLEHLQKMLKEHLPKFKIPIKAFTLPEQMGLKVNRKALAERAFHG
ncbi:MAG: AMP-binding protein [Verrucomicrobia bacterium]|nr:AMP-binding protein [Verrucomicrobiota bacterium]